MLDLAEIRAALATAATATGLQTFDYPPEVPPVGEAGTLIIDEPDEGVSVSYHDDFDGHATVRLLVLVLVGAADVQQATRQLDAYRGLGLPTSVADALESAGAALGLSVRVGEASVTGRYDFGSPSYFGCTWTVEVLA